MAKPGIVNPQLAALVQDAARREGLNQADLVRITGFGRGPIGSLWRGEVARVAAEVANAVCRELGIPMRRFLSTAGYDVESRAPSIPKGMEELIDYWPRLSPAARAGLLALAREAATATPDAESGDPSSPRPSAR